MTSSKSIIRHTHSCTIQCTYELFTWSVLCCVLLWLGPTDHDDVIKWKHFPRYWTFVRGIQRSPVNSPHKGQWINGWVNNREAGDLRRHRGHYDVTVMFYGYLSELPHRHRHSRGMMTPSNGNIYRVTGHLCREFTGHRWIPHTKASDAEF